MVLRRSQSDVYSTPKLQHVIDQGDAQNRGAKQSESVQPLGVLTEPIVLASRNFYTRIDVLAGVIRTINPFGGSQIRIQENDQISMHEFRTGFCRLKSNRF